MHLRRFIAGVVASVVGAVTFAAIGVTGGTAAAAPSQEPDPRLVIVIAGTGVNQPVADMFYRPQAERIRSDGYEVHIFGLPGSGLGDIRDTSQALKDFAEQKLADSDAETMDLVGHSQGGLVGRYYITRLGGEDKVDRMVSLGTPQHGTTWANIGNFLGVDAFCQACDDMSHGSDFLTELNDPSDSEGDVHYTNIASRFDEVVVPYPTAFQLADENVTNVLIHDQCPLRPVEHILLPLDGTVHSGVRQALADEDDIRLDCLAFP